MRSYEVIIIGGSYAGLSAGMTLGRSLRKTLIIDSNLPCNRFTTAAHNFITQDGVAPDEIRRIAKEQVLQYPSVDELSGRVVRVAKEEYGFQIFTDSDQAFKAEKLLLTTGVKDRLLPTPGFTECWGKTIVHCPYCHGYELKGLPTGILLDDKNAAHLIPLVQHLASDVQLLTNGNNLSLETEDAISALSLERRKIIAFEHENTQLTGVRFADQQIMPLSAIYYSPPFSQSLDLAAALGLTYTDTGHIAVDNFQQTHIPGLFAAGDCATPLRAVSVATAQGTVAGAAINKALSE